MIVLYMGGPDDVVLGGDGDANGGSYGVKAKGQPMDTECPSERLAFGQEQQLNACISASGATSVRLWFKGDIEFGDPRMWSGCGVWFVRHGYYSLGG
ncbi:hypothetical protein PoB_005453500 [Plakobranchus ocellatus]|uniref:Uncharacterized protein n=1 Tax=Plakobranchus ocellatus TaxID=259542 RepID=A0AAV4C5P0_9GAST|nr:hypothetical protein PoB_005453500 [Plakobranchus ocellatus]